MSYQDYTEMSLTDKHSIVKNMVVDQPSQLYELLRLPSSTTITNIISQKRNIGAYWGETPVNSNRFDVKLPVITVTRYSKWMYSTEVIDVVGSPIDDVVAENAILLVRMWVDASRALYNDTLELFAAQQDRHITFPQTSIDGGATTTTVFGEIISSTGSTISLTITDHSTHVEVARSLSLAVNQYDMITEISHGVNFNSFWEAEPRWGGAAGADVKPHTGVAKPASKSPKGSTSSHKDQLADIEKTAVGDVITSPIAVIEYTSKNELLVTGWRVDGEGTRTISKRSFKVIEGCPFYTWAINAIGAGTRTEFEYGHQFITGKRGLQKAGSTTRIVIEDATQSSATE